MPMVPSPGPHEISGTFVHLRDSGVAEPLPAGATFWGDLSAGRYPQLEQGRLMSHSEGDADWPVWERHPHGDEIVMLLSGAVDLVLQEKGAERVVELRTQGAYVIVPAGTWHTARMHVPSSILFITPGRGTEHRPVGAGRT